MPITVLADFLRREGIFTYAAIPFDACHVIHPGILGRFAPFAPQTAILFLVPYYAGETENISRYAAAGDYHAYTGDLFARLIPQLTDKTGYTFYGFSDHSPIDERHAAAVAGLGMIGDNGLLINEEYGSFVFIAAVLTNAPPSVFSAVTPIAARRCIRCGACRTACPTGILRGDDAPCLSAVTQRKGDLTEQEKTWIQKTKTVWGCDVCQTICPYNQRIIKEKYETPIRFFKENRIAYLTRDRLDAMTENEFSSRAFSFRGRGPIGRNLDLLT